MQGETDSLSHIRHTVKKKGKLFMSVYLLYQSVTLLGWEDGRMEGEATKGCKLIRFLSLHAPLPVLLLYNPCGHRCAAQRLNSRTQWGNNWYKQHLAAETLSVIQSDTVSPLPPVFLSKSAFSLIQSPLFVVPALPSSLRSVGASSGFSHFVFHRLNESSLSLIMPFLSSSLLISSSSTSSRLCQSLMFFCLSSLR